LEVFADAIGTVRLLESCHRSRVSSLLMPARVIAAHADVSICITSLAGLRHIRDARSVRASQVRRIIVSALR
jgi:hypothetical protein